MARVGNIVDKLINGKYVTKLKKNLSARDGPSYQSIIICDDGVMTISPRHSNRRRALTGTNYKPKGTCNLRHTLLDRG